MGILLSLGLSIILLFIFYLFHLFFIPLLLPSFELIIFSLARLFATTIFKFLSGCFRTFYLFYMSWSTLRIYGTSGRAHKPYDGVFLLNPPNLAVVHFTPICYKPYDTFFLFEQSRIFYIYLNNQIIIKDSYFYHVTIPSVPHSCG